MWWLRKKGKLAVLPHHIVLPIWLCLYISTTHGHVPCRHVSYMGLFIPDYCRWQPHHIIYLLSLFLLFTIYTMARTQLNAKKATGGIATHHLLSKSSSASATPPTTPAVPPATLPTTTPPPPPPACSPAVPPPTLSEQTDLSKNNIIFFCLIHFLSWELTIFLSSVVCASTTAS